MSKEKETEKNFKKMAFKLIKKSEDSLQDKIVKLLDLQLEILEDEVNALKFKITHNKMRPIGAERAIHFKKSIL